MASWLMTITVLLVFAVALVAAIPVVRRRLKDRQETIAAEVWADDIIEGAENRPEKVAPAKSLVSSARPVYRWGRIAIFGAGMVSLLVALVTSVLAPFTALAWFVPVLFLGLTVASLATLRYLAIQDSKKRKNHRKPVVQPVEEVSQVILKPQDGEAKEELAASASGAQQVKPIKHRQQKPINYASKSLRYARTHHQAQPEKPVEFKKLPSGRVELEEQVSLTHEGTWEVRETPRPTYLDAEVRYRSIETSQVTIDRPEASESATLKDAVEKAYSMNLDDVLSRRRAQ